MQFYGGDTGPDTEKFLGICAEACTKRDYGYIESAVLEPGSTEPDHRLLKGWISWETALRNELSALRAKTLGKDPSRHRREEAAFYTEIAQTAREAYNQETPLQAEEVLNKARWNRLEDLETGHHFDTEKLMIYYLKLQVNRRRAQFTEQAGETNFGRVYTSVYSPEAKEKMSLESNR